MCSSDGSISVKGCLEHTHPVNMKSVRLKGSITEQKIEGYLREGNLH